jgi:hypothetical protein
MPSSLSLAINFLQTQWSSINNNKLKGILAEIRLKEYLSENGVFYGPGGWIMVAGQPTGGNVPTQSKVCLLPRTSHFSWNTAENLGGVLLPAEISAYMYFRQLGIQTFFVDPTPFTENQFTLPTPSANSQRANYPKPYALELKQVGQDGSLTPASTAVVFSSFPPRTGNRGLRCNALGRIDPTDYPWTNPSIVSDLFWFEYTRYYYQCDYLISNNDLDMYIIGASGSAYPVELKSKKSANSRALGDWFGIDMGPFAKLAFFTANGMNTDALYIVEEVNSSGQPEGWFGIRYTELVKACSWVGQGGGTGMTGGRSSTYKVPKAAFSLLDGLLLTL